MAVLKAEVLSPAGSMESLIAAVRSGADAVYMGAGEFNARRNADNFEGDSLREAIEYCRVRGVKVYLTLNIMIKESELEDALALVERAYSLGVSGVIIADLGLALAVHNIFPELPLHASTQMTVHSPAALAPLKAFGITRVVAAREMSKAALKMLCEEAERLGMEIEVFVQGALCMCVSGQCLLSSVIGTRSGNRGLCAGPCRLPFKAPSGTGYDLSLKDLSLYEYINELREMGISSFKIEGRMKRPEYIAAATNALRNIVDTANVDYAALQALEKVFSRSGFTAGYYQNKLGRDMFGIRTEEDARLSKEIHSSIHNIYRAERQSVPISIKCSIKKDEKIKLSFICKNTEVIAIGDIPAAAQSKSAAAKDIMALLSRLGGTPYFAQSVEVDLDDGLFVAASAINALRREATEKLSALRAKAPAVIKNEFSFKKTESSSPKESKIYIRISEIAQLPADLSAVAAVIVPIEIADKLPALCVPIILDLPRYIDDEQDLYNKICELREKGFKKVCCGNLSAIAIAEKAKCEIMGGIGLNTASRLTCSALKAMGVNEITLSAEISMQSAAALASDIPKGIFAYGRIPLMLMKNCPIKNGKDCKICDKQGALTDRMGMKFPVRCRRGYSELLNCKYLYLGDKLSELKSFDFLLLYFTDEDTERVESIIKSYVGGAPAPKDATNGLYYRTLA